MRRLQVLIWAVTLGTTLTVLGLGAAEAPEKDVEPSGKGIGTLHHPPTPDQEGENSSVKSSAGSRTTTTTTNGINYHGGPVMTNPTKIYYIWYGTWTNNTATTILPYFAANIGASPYYHINSTYKNGSGVPVSMAVTLGGATSVTNYPYGNALSDTQIRQVVIDSMNSGKPPIDENGIYFVLTSADVNATSGFCTNYCGWHTYFNATVSGTNKAFKYSFVGDPTRCLSACAAQSASPNGNPGADGMASIIAHELEEAAANPQLNAWYDTRGYENADKCAWTFGTVFSAPNGTTANMKLGPSNLNFLIQRNWVNANGGYCALSY